MKSYSCWFLCLEVASNIWWVYIYVELICLQSKKNGRSCEWNIEILHQLKSCLVLARVMVIRAQEVNREQVLRVVWLLWQALVLRSWHHVHLLLGSLILSYLSSKVIWIISITLQLKKNMLHMHICSKREEGREGGRERPVLAELSYCFGAQSPAQGNPHFVLVKHSFKLPLNINFVSNM